MQPFFALPKCPRVQMRAVVHRYMHRTHTHRVKGRWCGRSDESPEHTCMQYGQPVSLCLGVRVTGVCVLFFLVTCCCFSYCLPCMCTSGLHAETHNTRTHTHTHTHTHTCTCMHTLGGLCYLLSQLMLFVWSFLSLCLFVLSFLFSFSCSKSARTRALSLFFGHL